MGPDTADGRRPPSPPGGGGPASRVNTALTGALDDTHGRTIAVYQDHDGVRIDAAGIEIMLTREASQLLRDWMYEAEWFAHTWERDNA
jgi:hypothetical protein